MVVMLDVVRILDPVAGEELTAVMARTDPNEALARRAAPIAVMPDIAVTHGIPVAGDPNEIGARSRGTHVNDTRRRRRPDNDADADGGVSGGRRRRFVVGDFLFALRLILCILRVAGLSIALPTLLRIALRRRCVAVAGCGRSGIGAGNVKDQLGFGPENDFFLAGA